MTQSSSAPTPTFGQAAEQEWTAVAGGIGYAQGIQVPGQPQQGPAYDWKFPSEGWGCPPPAHFPRRGRMLDATEGVLEIPTDKVGEYEAWRDGARQRNADRHAAAVAAVVAAITATGGEVRQPYSCADRLTRVVGNVPTTTPTLPEGEKFVCGFDGPRTNWDSYRCGPGADGRRELQFIVRDGKVENGEFFGELLS